VLTGRGADIIIIDDPLKAEEALSQSSGGPPTNGTTTSSTAGSTTQGRCDRPDHAPAADDLAGHVLAQEDWDVARFPAIAEEDESWGSIPSRDTTRLPGGGARHCPVVPIRAGSDGGRPKAFT
jgi:hypothetical protein